MYQKSTVLFLTCETPLHAGSGDSLGVVDLPIQRERHTSFPKIEASSLKGALRENVETNLDIDYKKAADDNTKKIISAFGSDGSGDSAGALAFTDARLLLFPVKSMKGVFAWITCPRVLKQFEKDMNISYKAVNNKNSFEITGTFTNHKENECYVVGDSDLFVIKSTPSSENNNSVGKIVLEEYAFNAIKKDLKINTANLEDWLSEKLFKANPYWAGKAKTSIVILNDDDFKDFVNLSTEVITRIKISSETGTVEKGALFTEEYLPTESVLYSLVFAADEFAKTSPIDAAANLQFLTDHTTNIFQLGGNATLGKGILRSTFHPIPEPPKS